jgi:4-hydroxybenzoyl-CoA thioesterase
MSEEAGQYDSGIQLARAEAANREVTVLFAHVDAAAIVFYPRFVEMMAQCFPNIVSARVPFELSLNFRKPVVLGDMLTFKVEDKRSKDAVLISGHVNGNEHLTIERVSASHILPDEAHVPDARSFVADRSHIQAWCVGADAALHLSRYYELANAAIEQWFERQLAVPFKDMNRDRQGIPTARLHTRVLRMPSFGEEYHIEVLPTRIGNSSLQFVSRLICGRNCLVTTTQVVVFGSLSAQGFQSARLPEPLRMRLDAQLAGLETG